MTLPAPTRCTQVRVCVCVRARVFEETEYPGDETFLIMTRRVPDLEWFVAFLDNLLINCINN